MLQNVLQQYKTVPNSQSCLSSWYKCSQAYWIIQNYQVFNTTKFFKYTYCKGKQTVLFLSLLSCHSGH